MRLSVVMPNYNDSNNFLKLIPKIHSYLSVEDEIIFIDDGSTDDSYKKILKLVKKKQLLYVKMYQNEKNIGVVETENIGANIASGEYLYFAASDDDVSPKFFESSINALKRYPKAGVCSTASVLEYQDKVKIKLPLKSPSKIEKFLSPLDCKRLLLSHENWISGNSCIYRRKYFLSEGGFRAELEGFCDVLLTLLIPMKYGAVFIPKVLTNFRLSNRSYAAKHYRIENVHLTIKIIDLIKNILEREIGQKFAEQWWGKIQVQIVASAVLKKSFYISASKKNKLSYKLLIEGIFYLIKNFIFNKFLYIYIKKALTLRCKRFLSYYLDKFGCSIIKGGKW